MLYTKSTICKIKPFLYPITTNARYRIIKARFKYVKYALEITISIV